MGFKKLGDKSGKLKTKILFERYPDIEIAYERYMELIEICNKNTIKKVPVGKLVHWYNRSEKIEISHFRTVIETMPKNYLPILNYFDHRSTNSAAERSMQR